MAVGKNKRLSKGGKKGSKKKIIDPFTRKEWYHVKAPANFAKRDMGITLVNRTQGTKIASEGLKGRVVEMSLGDLSENSEGDFRKFNLIIEDVQGSNCLTNFHGMRFTRDKECQMVKKWHTLIEANCAVKTADGYLLRVFAIGFTKRSPTHQKKTCYAQSAKVRAIRAKMNEVIGKEVGGSELKEVVNKLIPDSIAKEMERQCQSIYPLQDVFVRKVKVLRKPKFDLGKLMDMHGDAGKGAVVAGAGDETGAPVDRPDDYEPPVVDEV